MTSLVNCAWCGAAAESLTGRCKCGGHLETKLARGPVADHGDSFFRKWRDHFPLNELPDLDIELTSPLVEAGFLARSPGDPRVYLKLDCTLPTGSTKDRAAVVALAYLQANGVTSLAMSSTGNTSTAFAHYARHFPEMQLHIFAGKDFAFRLQGLGADNVVVHLINGTFVEAGKKAQQYALAEGMCWEGGFFNPGRRDGLKTAYLEAVGELGERPSMYVQAVSSAMGPVSVEQASRQTASDPDAGPDVSLLCVQQASCAPMARTWKAGLADVPAEYKVRHPAGIAKAILRGDPSQVYPSVRRAVASSSGDFVAVTDHQIRHAQKLLWNELGLAVCESSAAAVAGYLECGPDWRARETRSPVVINITGRDRCEIDR